jgi:hypothetical protein
LPRDRILFQVDVEVTKGINRVPTSRCRSRTLCGAGCRSLVCQACLSSMHYTNARLTTTSYLPCRSFSPLVAPIKHTDSTAGLADSRQGSFLGGRTQSVTGLAPGGLLNISRSAQSCTTASFDAWHTGSNLSPCTASQGAAAVLAAAAAQHELQQSTLGSVSGHRLSSMAGRVGEDDPEKTHNASEPQLLLEPSLQLQGDNAGDRGHHQQREWPTAAAEGLAAGGGEVHAVEAMAVHVSLTPN